MTENGEHGATPTRTIEPGDGSWCRSIASCVAAKIASRSSTTSSGGRPPVALPEVHRAAGRVEPQADRRGRGDLGGQQVPAVAGEHVVVVGACVVQPVRASHVSAPVAPRLDTCGVEPRPDRVEAVSHPNSVASTAMPRVAHW